MSKAVKKVTNPLKKITKAATKPFNEVFKVAKGIVDPKAPNIDIPDQTPPAPPAPEPEQFAGGVSTPEDVGRRRKRNGRGSLRIDLNTGGSGGQGVNVPVG